MNYMIRMQKRRPSYYIDVAGKLSVTKRIWSSLQARVRVTDSIIIVNRPDNLKVNIIYIIGHI